MKPFLTLQLASPHSRSLIPSFISLLSEKEKKTFKHGIIIIIFARVGNTTRQILSQERNTSWRRRKVLFSFLVSIALYYTAVDRNNGEHFPLSSFDYTPHFVLGILCQDYILENNIEKLMITI